MKGKKQSILLFGGEENLDLSVVRCLGSIPTLELNYVAKKKSFVSLSRYVNSFFLLPNSSDENIFIHLKDILKQTGSNVLIPIDEISTELVIKHKKILEDFVSLPPLPTYETFKKVIYKDTLNTWLKEQDLPHAYNWKVPNNIEDKKGYKDLKFPLILKPKWDFVGDFENKELRLFSQREDLEKFLNTENIIEENYILQEYIPGNDVDCSLLCKNGEILAYTLQRGFIAQDLKYSPGIDFFHKKDFLDQIKQTIKKLEWSGVCHLDFRYDEKEKTYKLIDFNSRYWATILGSFIAGVNFPYLAIQSALLIKFPVPEYENTCFVLTSTAFREFFSLKQKENFSLRQTGLYLALKDPLPVIGKFIYRIKS